MQKTFAIGASNYTVSNINPNILVDRCNPQGWAMYAIQLTSITADTSVGIYGQGCQLILLENGMSLINTATDGLAPTWISGEGVLPPLADGEIWIGNGSNVATALSVSGDETLSNAGVAKVVGLQGVKLSATVGTPFTNEIIQYSGNPTVGYVNATHKDATASSGVATMPGSNNGTNDGITTESLTTAAGSTVTLQVIDGQFTSSSKFQYNIRRGTATTGIPYVVSYTQTGGSVTFTIANIDPVAAFNGTLIMNLIAF